MSRGILPTTIVVLVLAAAGLHAQTVYRVGPVMLGARGAALADAYTSSAFDVESMYWNPASLGLLERASIVVGHYRNWDDRSAVESFATPVHLTDDHTLGLGFTVGHATDITFSHYGVDLGYAFNVMSTLSLGAIGSVRYATVGGQKATAGWASLGVFYFPEPGISYGFVYRNAGSGLILTEDSSRTDLRRDARLGRSAEVSVTMEYPTRARRPLLTMHIASERFFQDSQYRIKGGIEIQPFDAVSLRAGYAVANKTAVGRYGIALTTARFIIDYAVSPSKLETRFDQLTLSYVLGGL